MSKRLRDILLSLGYSESYGYEKYWTRHGLQSWEYVLETPKDPRSSFSWITRAGGFRSESELIEWLTESIQ